MMKSALAAYIINYLKILRKAYISSYLFLGVIFASYIFFSAAVRVDLSPYNLLTYPAAFLLCAFTRPESNPEGGDNIERLEGEGARVATYSRVSTSKQVKGQSLEVQKESFDKMKEVCKPTIIYSFTDPGKSGRDFDKRKIKAIMQLAEGKLIDELWITWVNRLGRDCMKLLLFCLNLCEEGVIIRTPERVYDLKELSNLLIFTIEANEAQRENERRAKTASESKARLFRMKKWNKPVPLGFRKKDKWLAKKPEWSYLIKDMYEKLLKGASLKSIIKFINAKYKDVLNTPLTRSQVRRMLSDSVYNGKPHHLGVIVEDNSLSFVDEETFSNAHAILSKMSSRHKPKGIDPIRELVELHGISALDFLEQIDIAHKFCGGRIRKNGSKVYGGVSRRLFECKKCHKQWIIPTNRMLKKIQAHFAGKENNFTKADNSVKYNVVHPLMVSSKNTSNKLKKKACNMQKLKPSNKNFSQRSIEKFMETSLNDNDALKKAIAI